jgi:hypothetical protein
MTTITTDVRICGRKITDLKNDVPRNLDLATSAAETRPKRIGSIEKKKIITKVLENAWPILGSEKKFS